MVTSAYNRTKDNRRVNMTLRVVILVMIFKTVKHRRIFNLVKTFVILGQKTLVEENCGILMTITDEALGLLAQLPMH